MWLVRKGYPEAAKKALIWLRGQDVTQVIIFGNFDTYRANVPTNRGKVTVAEHSSEARSIKRLNSSSNTVKGLENT